MATAIAAPNPRLIVAQTFEELAAAHGPLQDLLSGFGKAAQSKAARVQIVSALSMWGPVQRAAPTPRPQRRSELVQVVEDPRSIDRVPVEVVPALLGQLQAVQGALVTRLATSSKQVPTPNNPDRLVDVDEAAALLGCSTSHLYHKADRYPFTVRDGHRLRFSLLGIQKWIERRQGRGLEIQRRGR